MTWRFREGKTSGCHEIRFHRISSVVCGPHEQHTKVKRQCVWL
jgi:hypothetical protein